MHFAIQRGHAFWIFLGIIFAHDKRIPDKTGYAHASTRHLGTAISVVSDLVFRA